MTNRGKLIIIEGTDCSGKETQCNLLVERLKKDKILVYKDSFPNYDSPTGKILGGPVQGKPTICESFFKDEAPRINPKVACLYYAADRLYNIKPIKDNLENGVNVILDRYTTSNMGFQTAKLDNPLEREKMVKFIETLEYDLLELPRPDYVIFLHMPYEKVCELKSKRKEVEDKVEESKKYLKDAEKAYFELAKIYNYQIIECVDKNGDIRSIEDINDELYKITCDILNQ